MGHGPRCRPTRKLTSGMELKFWKLESIGNDFPLIHADDFKGDLSALAQKVCDRHFGVGGDGLLTLQKVGDGQLKMRMFNPDGTEDFCGNGLRCAAHHAVLEGWAKDKFALQHLDRTVPVTVKDARIETEIGSASYDPKLIPVNATGEPFKVHVWSGMDGGMPLSFHGSVLTTGSTHTVIPTVAIPDDESFLSVSPKIEVDPKFPARTSVIWSKEVAPMHLQIRIWERGVGETQGCGTGSSAAAADYLRRKGLGGTVRVDNPGGTVEVSMETWHHPITIAGTARQVYTGILKL